MGRTFGWEYPPGVSGSEPQIAGYPPCPECGFDAVPGESCEECGEYFQTPEEAREDYEADAYDRERDRSYE